MNFNTFLFLSQLILFLNENVLISGKALVGQNIRQVRSGEFSFVVSIMHIEPGHPQSGGDHFCTGVLITRKDLLTAEHCVEGEDLNNLQLLVGTIDLRRGRKYNPFWWITYPSWIRQQNGTDDYEINDIANMRLLDEVSNRLIPVRLSRLTNNQLYNADVLTAGWGLNNQGITPNIMDVAVLKIIENSVCETKMERIVGVRVPIENRILCSYVDPFILVEGGDSGGPVMFRNRLIAINQGTCPLNSETTHPNQMNLHMSVDYYRQFINYMKNHQ